MIFSRLVRLKTKFLVRVRQQFQFSLQEGGQELVASCIQCRWCDMWQAFQRLNLNQSGHLVRLVAWSKIGWPLYNNILSKEKKLDWRCFIVEFVSVHLGLNWLAVESIVKVWQQKMRVILDFRAESYPLVSGSSCWMALELTGILPFDWLGDPHKFPYGGYDYKYKLSIIW